MRRLVPRGSAVATQHGTLGRMRSLQGTTLDVTLRRFAQEAGTPAPAPRAPRRLRLGLATVAATTSLVAADAWFYSDALGLRRRLEGEKGGEKGAPAATSAAMPTPAAAVGLVPATSATVPPSQVAGTPAAEKPLPKEDSEAMETRTSVSEPEKFEAPIPAPPSQSAELADAEAAKAVAAAAAEAEAAAAEAAAENAGFAEALKQLQMAMEQDLHEAILAPASLRIALESAEAQVAQLSEQWQEKALPETFQAARGRLKASLAAQKWRQAKGALEVLQKEMQTEAAGDVVSFQAALEALTVAEVQLRAQGADLKLLGFQADLRVACQQQLVLMNATKKRTEALQSLQGALTSRKEVASAFDAAKAAGVDVNSSEMLLAAALTRPSSELCSDLEEDDHRPLGITEEDFAAAAKALAQDYDSSQLEEHCARLAELLATTTDKQTEFGRKHLRESVGNLRERLYARAVKEFQLAYLVRSSALECRRQRAKEDKSHYVQQVASEARLRFAAQREAKVEALRQDLGIALASICQEDAQDTQLRLGLIQGPLSTLEVARRESIGQGKVSLSAKLLSAAVEETPEALQALQAEASGFVSALLKDMQVEEHPLSVSEMRRSLMLLLRQLAAVALSPPSESLLGRLVSESLGSSFARLYELTALAASPEAEWRSGGASEVERNLATLTLAAQRLEVNDFCGAVTALENLTGDCLLRAGNWLRRARQALLWQQTFEALQAKARCLNAA